MIRQKRSHGIVPNHSTFRKRIRSSILTEAVVFNIRARLGKKQANNRRPREVAPSSSRSCRREKNAKAKRRFPQSLTAIFITG
jgi:hypothetical protein